ESRYFFTLFVFYILLTAVQAVVARGSFHWNEVMVFRCIVIGLCSPLIWTRKLWYHWLATAAVLLCATYLLFGIAWH
ncbi:MAG: hypothetical protein JSS41_01085, partial [Proteobacteria bacterium]|nr:hypothetical protein [Pseudomonadota bacterium]